MNIKDDHEINRELMKLRTYSTAHNEYIKAVIEKIMGYYQDNLTGIGIFGSYARKENRLNSDLDLFILLNNAPNRKTRLQEFVQNIEMNIEKLSQKLYERDEIYCEISPYILTLEEALFFNPIYADMVDHFVILSDRYYYITRILSSTKKLLGIYNAVKIRRNNTWEWQFNQFLGGKPL